MTLLGASLSPASVWGLWLNADAVRRRIGVPVRAPSARDAWVVGTALALSAVLPSLLPSLVFPPLPSLVDTTGDLLLPVIGRLTDATAEAMLSVPFYLLIVGALMFVRAPSGRIVVLGVATIIASVGVTLPGPPSMSDWLPRIAVQAVGLLLMIVVFWRLGRTSMEAWLVGALVSGALGAGASAIRTASDGDRVAHLLGAVVALGIASVVASRPREAEGRRDKPVSASQSIT